MSLHVYIPDLAIAHLMNATKPTACVKIPAYDLKFSLCFILFTYYRQFPGKLVVVNELFSSTFPHTTALKNALATASAPSGLVCVWSSGKYESTTLDPKD